MGKNLINNNSLYKIWSQVPKDYYQKGIKKNLLQRIWHRNKIKHAKKIIQNLSFNQCLDVGCASGYMISEIAAEYPKATFFGVDVYDKAIKYAKIKYPHIKFYRSPAEKMSFKENSFNLIISYETIEHVQNPPAFLLEIKRVLKKDGTFILAMDSGNLLFKIVWYIWENTTGKVWQNAHLNAFHHSQLEKLIKSSGFKIKKKLLTHFSMEVVFILQKRAS